MNIEESTIMRNDFIKGYKTALVRSESISGVYSNTFDPDEKEYDGTIPCDVDIYDFDDQSSDIIKDICYDFITNNMENIVAAREKYSYTRLGEFLYYAKQGHGISFIDDFDIDCLKELQSAANFDPLFIEWRVTNWKIIVN